MKAKKYTVYDCASCGDTWKTELQAMRCCPPTERLVDKETYDALTAMCVDERGAE